MATYTVGLTGSGANYICPASAAQTKINEALTAADTAGGGIVQLLANSTFNITGQIKIGPNTRLTGASTSKIKVENYACGNNIAYGTAGAQCTFPDGTPVIGVISGKTAANIEIDGFEFDGNLQNQYTKLGLAHSVPSSSGSGVERAIAFYGASGAGTKVTNIYIHDMSFHDCFGEALHIRYGQNIRFRDNICSNLQHDAVFLVEVTGDSNEVSGGTIHAITDGGVRLDNCTNAKIHDIDFYPYLGTNNNGAYEHGENGIQIANESNKTTLTNNIEIYNCTFNNTGIAGILLNDYLQTAGATPQTVRIWNNTFTDCGYTSNANYGSGVSLYGWGNGITIEHNTFNGCYQEGIQILKAISGTSTYTVDIKNNNIINTRGDGHSTNTLTVKGYGIYNAVPTKFSAVVDGNYFTNNLNGNVYPTTMTHTNDASSMVSALPADGTQEETETPTTTTPIRYIPGVRTTQPEWEFLGYYILEEDGITPHTSYVNGWPVYISGYSTTTRRVLATNKSPTIEGWNVGDFGLEGSSISVTCVEDSLENAWKSISAWYARTPAILELGDVYEGWYLEGIPENHSSVVRKSSGDVPGELYVYTIAFTSIIPKFQNTVKRVRGRNISGNMSWSSDDTKPGNQLKNGSFELWPLNTGMSWHSQASVADNSWRCLAYNKVMKTLVAGAESGTDNRIMIQQEGGSWKVPSGLASAANRDSGWRGACWIPANDTLPNGRVVLVANAGTAGYRVITSDDCETFTARATPADNAWTSVCYIPPNDTLTYGRVVACAYSGTNRIMYSDDYGVTWSAVASASEASNWLSICYSEGLSRLICVSYTGDTTHQIQYSDNYGATWTLATTPAYQTWCSVVRAESLGLFVACSKSGTQKIMTSADGVTGWALKSIPADAQLMEWRGLSYSDEHQLLVAVADAGTGTNEVMISTDAETWTMVDSPYANAWWAVKFLPYEDTTTSERIIEPIDVSITQKVSTVTNWNFETWSGGTTDVAPTGWTLATAGQTRSTRSPSGYCYKVTGNGTDAVRGSIYQATNLTPGYYTIGAWYHIEGATQGSLNIDIQGGSPVVDLDGLQITENSVTTATWNYTETRAYINSTNPSLRIFVDGTPNTGSSWYVDSVILFPDATDFEGTEVDNGNSLVQTFEYTPASVLATATLQTRFMGIEVINSDGTFAYPVREVIVKIDGVSTTNFERIGRFININVSGLSATGHTIEVDFLYANIRGRFTAVGGAGTTYRVMYSDDYGLVENIAPDGWDKISNGQTIGAPLIQADSKSYLIKGDGVTADIGHITQPVQCDAGVSYDLTVVGKVRGLTQGKLTADIFSNGSVIKQVYWDNTESGDDPVTKNLTVKFTVTPYDAVIRVHGTETPNLGSELYVDGISFEKSTDHELNSVGNSIITYGNEDTVPDIEVRATVPAIIETGSSSGSQVSFNTGADGWYTSAAPYYKTDDTSLEYTVVLPALTNGSKYQIDQVSVNLKTLKAGVIAYCAVNVLCAGLFGGVETRVAEFTTTSTTATVKTKALSLLTGTNQTVTLKYFMKTSNTATRASANQFGYKYTPLTPYSKTNGASAFSLYNAADPTTVIDMCNTLQYGCTITVKADYTGSFNYSTNFEDTSVMSAISATAGTVTQQTGARTLTLASGSKVEFEFDTKFPITGVPFIETFVTSGTPQFSIGVDGSWQAIDSNATASLTNELLYKELNNLANLQLAGETVFSIRIEPKAGESLVLSTIYVHCDLVTIDAPRPKIYATGQPNTFTSILSGNAVVCTLKYRDRNMVV